MEIRPEAEPQELNECLPIQGSASPRGNLLQAGSHGLNPIGPTSLCLSQREKRAMRLRGFTEAEIEFLDVLEQIDRTVRESLSRRPRMLMLPEPRYKP